MHPAQPPVEGSAAKIASRDTGAQLAGVTPSQPDGVVNRRSQHDGDGGAELDRGPDLASPRLASQEADGRDRSAVPITLTSAIHWAGVRATTMTRSPSEQAKSTPKVVGDQQDTDRRRQRRVFG
jgi:hypothetical protein